MKKLFALASMMIVISVSAQQPKMDKQEGKRIEVQQQKDIKDKQAKKDVDKRDEFSKKDKKSKDRKQNKKVEHKKGQEKVVVKKKQQHDKKDFPKGQKEVAYHPIKHR